MRITRAVESVRRRRCSRLAGLLPAAAAPARRRRPPRRVQPRTADAAPTEAGTSFRTATEVEQGQKATASASAGDYLYWSFPADAGQRPTVEGDGEAAGAARHGARTWQLDVYDGLRRRQACQYGAQTRTAAPDAASVELACTLRTVRAWAEPWANDPLPGTLLHPADGRDLAAGRPRPAGERGGRGRLQGHRRFGRGGRLAGASRWCRASPCGPEAKEAAEDSAAAVRHRARTTAGPPAGGPTAGSGRRSAVSLAALAGIGGYALTRGGGRPPRTAARPHSRGPPRHRPAGLALPRPRRGARPRTPRSPLAATRPARPARRYTPRSAFATGASPSTTTVPAATAARSARSPSPAPSPSTRPA